VPDAPLPNELRPFVEAARPAVIGTVRPEGAPTTTATRYGWEDGWLLLSMTSREPRLRNVRAEPRVSLTILGDSF
jgi:nitroimidazol reductase NimA-like FMN-containing flavoprotein (pyridoxamine 5'-phosphate oxidase superfamily)